MNIIFILTLALRNTFNKQLRTLLVVTGIALTSGVVIGLFGVQTGLERLVDYEVKNGQSLDIVSVNRREVQGVKLNKEKISQIQSISGVSEVSESVGLSGAAVYHGVSLNAPVYAVGQSYFSMSPSTALVGEVEQQPQGDSIIVSDKILEVFGIDLDKAVGKEVQLKIDIAREYINGQDEGDIAIETRKYTIKGVVDRGELPVIFVNIDNVKDRGLTSVSELNLRLANPNKLAEVREAVERLGLKTSSVQDTIEQINDLFEVIRNILIVFVSIVFAITITFAFTVITLTLMEETRQVGFLRIMGLRHFEVRRLFIIQSIIMTVMGAVIGIVFSVIGGLLLNGYARVLVQGSAFSQKVSVFVLPVLPVIIVIVLSFVVGWIIAIIPARRAVSINPREELNL